MIISVNWLKKFTQIDLGVHELELLIGSRLVEVEKSTNLSDKYKDVLAVKVVSSKDIEGSDHLHVVMIDDGGKREGVDRDENGHVQVVCGAPNVTEGMMAAWLPPESIVPQTYSEAEPFKLSKKPLRGVMSNGMLASASELGLFEDHTGIIELDKTLAPGSLLTEAYGLDDYLLDIENKSLTHRPDTFGIVGFAREVAAITAKQFETPEWLKPVDKHYEIKDKSMMPEVNIDDANLSAQYSAVVLSGADSTKQSPLEIQTYLARIGMRPINAPVDVTNYLMMATGQPLHTFDYDKLVALSGGKPQIHVRLGKTGEKLLLLDDREIEVTPDDIIISAGDVAIGLAGGMGCKNTAIDESTKNILLEVATFNLYNMRGTQMRHGIFSEAITRFTKGQPSALCLPVLHEAVRLLGEWSGAKPVSDVVVAKGNDDSNQSVVLEASYANKLLGTDISTDEIETLLKNAEFEIKREVDKLEVLAPYWRTDVHIAEDLVEEIGRLRGYDAITPTLPLRASKAVSPSSFDVFRAKVRRLMARAGANEIYSYSFIHGDVLSKNSQDKDNSYRITNAISPDLQYYRQSLTPGLLALINPNVKQGYDRFAVYELNKTHSKVLGRNDENLPIEANMLAYVETDKKSDGSAAFYQAKAVLEFVLSTLGVKHYLSSGEEAGDATYARPFEPKRSGVVTSGGKVIGIVGEYKTNVKSGNKLPDYTAGFELDLDQLFAVYDENLSSYKAPSKYPSTSRDVCFQVADHQTYGAIMFALEQASSSLDINLSFEPIDIYQAEGSDKKNITIKMNIEPESKTLTSDEANKITEELSKSVCVSCHATVI